MTNYREILNTTEKKNAEVNVQRFYTKNTNKVGNTCMSNALPLSLAGIARQQAAATTILKHILHAFTCSVTKCNFKLHVINSIISSCMKGRLNNVGQMQQNAANATNQQCL